MYTTIPDFKFNSNGPGNHDMVRFAFVCFCTSKLCLDYRFFMSKRNAVIVLKIRYMNLVRYMDVRNKN